jgi:tetratricopeptide (TPR) repeat protein
MSQRFETAANLRTLMSYMPRFIAPLTLACALSVPLLAGCGRGAEAPRDGVSELRDNAADSNDGDEVARWLLAELLSPGGKADQALKARARLDSLKAQGMLAELGRGLDDAAHGRPDRAADDYMRALVAAGASSDERAPLVAWFSAQQAYEYRDDSPGFGERWQKSIESLLENPGHIGWRAYGTVIDLWSAHAWSKARVDLNEEIAQKLGCVRELRLAGPFGDDNAGDLDRSFAAEAPGPWPQRWPLRAGRSEAPRVLETERTGCDYDVDESVAGGVTYAESFVELADTTRVVLTVAGAWRVWVDDRLVLDRDLRTWGIWPKFGVQLELGPGRHRILAKMGGTATSIRLVNADGRPLALKSSANAAPGYTFAPPTVLADPNVLLRFVKDGKVIDPGDDVTRFLAAFLVNLEGEADVASVLMEPLVKKPEVATGLALSQSARFVDGDPIFDQSQTRDLTHELHERAAKHDPRLWQPRLALALWEAEQKGPVTAVTPLEQLAREFPRVPELRFALAQLYGQLGWKPELRRTARELVREYPDSEEALGIGIELYEAEGDFKRVDDMLARLVEKYPDTEVPLTRALARHDYKTALEELRRLGARRPERKDLAERIYDVMVRAGNDQNVWKKLQAAIDKEPRDVHSRLALADARIARGDHDVLGKTLADAVQAGADASIVEEAVDLIEGMTALEPYRIDARKVIAEYEAAGKHLPGTAARVLDYGAVWVRADGSSRMLEHEVIRIQSEEAISQFAEAERLSGLALHQRVIKKDGRVLEPEFVAEKPTVTMPHLEVGDYVETEHIVSNWGDGSGTQWVGPAWFFREENIAYARSEFLVVAPADKKLLIDTQNDVPEPVVTRDGPLVARRWRVDFSPAAPVEPFAAPASEFLPRVAVGWGVSFDNRLRQTSGSVVDLTPVDPRILRIAQNIVGDVPKEKISERAKLLYRWVLDSVEEGQEEDGRRVIVSRNGNRWKGFITLCRALGISVDYALAENRLSLPPKSELTAAQRDLVPLLRLESESGPLWLTVNDKYAPFGYVPAALRGEKAYLLTGDTPVVVTVPEHGALDGIHYDGTGTLEADGSAKLSLRLRFYGKFAAALRNGLAQIPENQLGNIIESRLLGRSLQGARLEKHSVEDVDALDEPLTLRVQVDVPHLATPATGGLVLTAPFMPTLGSYASLSKRVTPLLLVDASTQSLDLDLSLAPGLKVIGPVHPEKLQFGDFEVKVADTAQGNKLKLNRRVDMAAGRVQPADYPKFQAFTRAADDALSGGIRLGR